LGFGYSLFPEIKLFNVKKLKQIYIIKELVLIQCSKFYASGGNVAKLITGLPKLGGERERES
jgi:hypothetical protein